MNDPYAHGIILFFPCAHRGVEQPKRNRKLATHSRTRPYRVSFPQLFVFLSVASMVASLAFPFIFHLLRKRRPRDQGQGAKRGAYIEIEYRVEIQKYTNIHHTGVGVESGSSIHSSLYKTKFNIIATRRNFFPSALRERSGPSSERERGS